MTSNTVNVPLQFKPWTVPNYVNFEHPSDQTESISVAVEAVSEEALDAVVATWLDQVYARVARPSPFRKPPETMAA